LFGKQYLIPEHDTDTKMVDVVSIDNEVVRLKELDLLNAEVKNQSEIDVIHVILKSII
jgi:hypothetical protein